MLIFLNECHFGFIVYVDAFRFRLYQLDHNLQVNYWISHSKHFLNIQIERINFNFPRNCTQNHSRRHDSTIHFPFGKWKYYHPQIKQKKQKHNYAANKKKKIAWFVSNCKHNKNSRLTYALQLQQHIQVQYISFFSLNSLQHWI